MILVLLMLASSLLLGCTSSPTGDSVKGPDARAAFAECLTDQGVKMYGAYWCTHCQNQKDLFGEAWTALTYFECSLPNRAGQTLPCKAAGIESYPTWEFADGSRTSGELTFAQLAEKSGCTPP